MAHVHMQLIVGIEVIAAGNLVLGDSVTRYCFWVCSIMWFVGNSPGS